MEYRSQDPDIDVPRLRLDEVVLAAAARVDPDRVAIHDDLTGERLRYGDIADRVRRVAAALADRGIGPGDVVALHLPNGVEFPILLLAVSACGATSTLVSSAESATGLHHQLRMVGAAMLIAHADLTGVSGRVAAALGLEEDRYVVVGAADANLGSAGSCPAGATSYGDLLAHPPERLDVAVDPEIHPVCLPFSSGTTGLPKPVILPHRALVANALQVASAVGMRRGQRTLAVLPFSHVYALTTSLLGSLVRGDTIVTMPRFSVAGAVRLLARERITLAYVVPPVVTLLGTHPAVDPADLSELRVLVSGAAALDPAIARAVADRLGVELLQGYGLSEMAPVTHMMRLGARMPVETVGTALPGISFRVVDPQTGRDVAPPPPGGMTARGELLVRGPNAMLGYLNMPAATAEVLGEDGWVHTGDLVTVDDRGRVRIVDRLKEVLKNRGFQVPPAELEALLQEYPGVADAAVTGVVGEDLSDERPFALVVRNVSAGPGPSEEGLLRYVADRTADYKHLVGVAFVAGVPRSDAGKIMRRQLGGLLPADRVPSRVGA